MAKTNFKLSMQQNFGRLKGVAGDVYTDVTSHWSKPKKGNYLSYKEIAAYSVGGMGQSMIAYFIGQLGFSASSMLLAATIGLRPMHIQTMMTIQTILNVLFFVIRGKLVDNTRTKWGRFRPYIAVMGIPLVILSVVYLFLPFETMTYMQKLIATFAFGISISMLSPLLTDTFGELGSCMTPNTVERTKMYTIFSIAFSFAPTVYNFLVPILSKFTGEFVNIATYRYVIAPVGIIGLVLVLFAAIGCKERVVTAESYVQKVSIVKGCVAVWKNKYWWIRTVSGFVGFLEGANTVLFLWIYQYSTQDMTTYAFLTTIMGTASFIAMISTPFLLSKLGNRDMLLFHNGVNIIFVIGMLATYKVPLLFFLFMYLNTAVNNTFMVYGPVHAADVKDSIQYQSGFRVDFTLGAAGMIAMPITIATGYFIPFVYESMGLTFNLNVLYDPLIRNNLFYILCLLSILGAALNLIPFFFYSLSREKHRTIYTALKYRAVNNNYANGKIDYRDIKEVVELYNEMIGYKNAPTPILKEARAAIKKARKTVVTDQMIENSAYSDMEKAQAIKLIKKELIKAAKNNLTESKKISEYKKAIEEIFIPEITKYNKPLMIAKVQMAEQIYSACDSSVIDLLNLEKIDLPSTLSLDKKEIAKLTKQHKKLNAKLVKTKKLIAKKYPNGLAIDYWQILQDALDETPVTNEEKFQTNRRIKKARKNYEKFQKHFSIYFDAKQLYCDSNASTHYDNYIAALYETACIESDKLDAEDNAKTRANTAAQKADIYYIKCKKDHAKKEKAAIKVAKKANVEYTPTEFDPKVYGIDENGYALKETGDELESLLDLLAAKRALQKAQKDYDKCIKALIKQDKGFTPEPFNPSDYNIDELGYPLVKEQAEIDEDLSALTENEVAEISENKEIINDKENK